MKFFNESLINNFPNALLKRIQIKDKVRLNNPNLKHQMFAPLECKDVSIESWWQEFKLIQRRVNINFLEIIYFRFHIHIQQNYSQLQWMASPQASPQEIFKLNILILIVNKQNFRYRCQGQQFGTNKKLLFHVRQQKFGPKPGLDKKLSLVFYVL